MKLTVRRLGLVGDDSLLALPVFVRYVSNTTETVFYFSCVVSDPSRFKSHATSSVYAIAASRP
jgi:hypothetical protein